MTRDELIQQVRGINDLISDIYPIDPYSECTLIWNEIKELCQIRQVYLDEIKRS